MRAISLGELDVEGREESIVPRHNGYWFVCPSGGGEWGNAILTADQLRQLGRWIREEVGE